MRIHEKAMDDYIHDFGDWDDAIVIPEACVVDVLRVRIVVRSGKQMLQLQRMLRDGFEVTVAGKTTRLRLIRAKNKLATIVAEERGLAGLDPTHFRNILNNVQLVHGGRTVFAELQVQHELPKSLATQIALGQADLALVLQKRRRAEHIEANRTRSVLLEASHPTGGGAGTEGSDK